jgi:1,4-dihydroxy-2-naphthoate octaprenyltransferase
MLYQNTLKLLRIPFSIFLMPIFLFALSQTQPINWMHAGLLFIVLHIFIYPSSNAYNSYMDKDETSIGGLEFPPQATKQLFYASVLMDSIGLIITSYISLHAVICIGLYILASRLYSYRGIRLKQFPIVGFLTVVFFQGFFTFYFCQTNIGIGNINWIAAIAASFLIAGVYPLTQIYQHVADAKDGVKTISMLLGYKGTFLFTVAMFTVANALLFYCFAIQHNEYHFWILSGLLFPTIVYFLYWMKIVWKDETQANFKNTMRMNLLASSSMNCCFLMLLFLNLHT